MHSPHRFTLLTSFTPKYGNVYHNHNNVNNKSVATTWILETNKRQIKQIIETMLFSIFFFNYA